MSKRCRLSLSTVPFESLWSVGGWAFLCHWAATVNVSMNGGIVYQSKEFYGDGECSTDGMVSTRVGGLNRLALADPSSAHIAAFSTLLFTLLFLLVFLTLAEYPSYGEMLEIKHFF